MILVTGGKGMAGKSLQKFLPDAIDAIYTSREDYDLMDYDQVENMFKKFNPKTVIHLAGKVGGIPDQLQHPYDFFYQNIIINSNIINACFKFKIEYLVAMSSVCVYSPEINNFPISEELSQYGEPDKSIYGYAYAKRMMPIQLKCLDKQFNSPMKYTVIHSSNLYGPYDCFETNKSHVVAALMRRFHENINSPAVELLGTGKALRQMTFVDDLSKFIMFCLKNKPTGEINFAPPENLSIKQIAAVISSKIGFSGKILFKGGSDGVLRRDVSIEKVEKLGFHDFTSFEYGIQKTYEWFKDNQC
jgi:GDP-L-fucose synthase